MYGISLAIVALGKGGRTRADRVVGVAVALEAAREAVEALQAGARAGEDALASRRSLVVGLARNPGRVARHDERDEVLVGRRRDGALREGRAVDGERADLLVRQALVVPVAGRIKCLDGAEVLV